MWTSESGHNNDDPREIQRQREAYARALDQQIAIRRAHKRQEEMEREELERKLAPRKHSPSKWLVEGGYVDPPTASQSTWNNTRSIIHHTEQRQDRGAATGEVSSMSSSHPRFRVTDESETSQRLRERAQQLEWKRILDEQVQEKARIKEKEEAERRRSEEGTAKEEARYLREQQLQAQRRVGLNSPARDNAALSNTTGSHARVCQPGMITSKQRPDFDQANNSHKFACMYDINKEDDTALPYQIANSFEEPEASGGSLPPPTPSRISNGQGRARGDKRKAFDRNMPDCLVNRQLFDQLNEARASHQQLEQQSRINDEYRSLLTAIRREREELRRERNEMRREKEELRIQRALLQLENEELIGLVDTQRVLNEQYQADLQQTQQAQIAQQQAQLQQYQSVSIQHQQSPIQPVAHEMNSISSGFEQFRSQVVVPDKEMYSRLHQIGQSLGDLNIRGVKPKPALLGRRRKPRSPMSMAEISATPPQQSVTTNVTHPSQFQRLSRYQPIPDQLTDNESVLNQSLDGESVFVPLSLKSPKPSKQGFMPHPTSSPGRQDHRNRALPFRSSRVIKSRGFYDYDQELNSEDRQSASGSVNGSNQDSDVGSSFYGDDEGET
ncbi:hypothetical protein CCR75_000977 [Bremia lactucae]|uniref:Uncharacterized protein n=1 Tax=Bremia lactucae TaxID=4779 RepID=A0A976FDM4_BRELC|nr:hypothetical protein CCR75_000977 [Bremia lactucae]